MNNTFTQRFMDNIKKQQANRKAYEQLTDEEKEVYKCKKQEEAEILDRIVGEATGVRPSIYIGEG